MKGEFIVVGDLHLRDTPPRCRQGEDWYATMKAKLDFINGIKKDVPIICVGDIFDEPYRNPRAPSHNLLLFAYQNLTRYLSCVGNHDLPAHNWELVSESGISTLDTLFRDANEDFTPFGGDLDGILLAPEQTIRGHKFSCIDWGLDGEPRGDILVMHRMCWHKEKPYPTAPDEGNALGIMRQYPNVKLFLIGDNHQRFIVEHEGRTLINVGSLFRMNVAQKDYIPHVFHFKADLSYEMIPVPLVGKVDIEYNTKKKELDERKENNLVAAAELVGLGKSVLGPIERLMRVIEGSNDNAMKQIIKEAIKKVGK